MTGTPLIVLDDDPTGTQSMSGVPVLLRLDEPTMRRTRGERPRTVHLMTNSRAYEPAAVRRELAAIATTALQVWPQAELVLRGDSTLRGHLLEEYEVVRDARFPGVDPVLLLMPGLPAAGRVTVDGVHLLEQDGRRIPLHDTEYARDPALGYTTSRLLAWAEERSHGHFVAAHGAEVHLDELRAGGAGRVADVVGTLARSGRPAVCCVDAERDDDLRLAVEGFALARRRQVPVVLRCAPAAAGALSGATASKLVPMPAARRVLVVCGSFVPTATRQLAALDRAHGAATVEADVEAFVGRDAGAEVHRLVSRLDHALRAGEPAVLTTPRAGDDGPGGLERQRAVAAGMAAVVRSLPTPPDVLITKGGVTSAVTVRDGLGADRADVVGPVEPGVGRWRVTAADGRPVGCLVVPGNVGDDDLLVRLLAGVSSADGPS